MNPRGRRRKATIFDVYTNGLLLGAPRNAPLDIGMAEAVGGDTDRGQLVSRVLWRPRKVEQPF